MPRTFPIDVTVERLVEFSGTIDAICRQEIGRLPTHTAGDPVGEILLLMAMEGQTGEQLTAWLHDQPEAVAFRSRPPRPAPVARPPLPAFPPGKYDRELPFTPPPADVLFYRGNFCGVRVPEVPNLPGMAGYTLPGGDKSLVMSLDVFKYDSVEQQNLILGAHAQRSYTHYQCSIGHAIEQGWSIDRYVEFSARVQAIVGFADHWFIGGGPWNTRDADASFWAPVLDPWIDALLASGAIDAACVGWQLDQFNKPGDPILSIIDYVAGRLGPSNIPIGTHWVNEAGGWWQTGGDPGDRFSWWSRMRNRVLWFHHQGSTTLDIPTYQAKLVDTLQPFGDGRMGTSGLFGDRPFGLVVYECSAQDQFDDPTGHTEDLGDLRSYLLCCTRAASTVSGFGNGARRPDGSPL